MASGVCWTHRLPRPPGTPLCSGLSALSWGPPATTANGGHLWPWWASSSPGFFWNFLQDTGTQSHDHWSTHSSTHSPVPWFYPLVFLEGMGAAIVMEPQECPAVLSHYLACSYGCPSYKNKLLRWDEALAQSCTKFSPAHRAALSHGNGPLKFTSSTCFLLSWVLILTFKVQHSKFSCRCSLAKPSLTLCNPTDCSTPGFPVFHHLLELAQTHVRWVSDAIQPSYPLSPPSSPALNLPQHQGLFHEGDSA